MSSSKLVPKWVLEVLDEVELSGGRVFEVTAGDIILLWRVGFDTFTTQSWFPKYLEHAYGIDAAFDRGCSLRPGSWRWSLPRILWTW